jgi:hypothetical protein
MAVITKHQHKFTLDNGIGGSLTDYSSQITKVEAPGVDINSAVHHTFSSRDGNTTVGGKTTTLKITVRVETTATSLYGILQGIAHSSTPATYNGTLSFLCGSPDTTTTGSHTWSGECKVTKMGSPIPAEAGKGDAMVCEFTLGGDGTITYAVAA